MTIGIGRSSRIFRAASMPSSFGILTSMIARSGCSERASATASSPSRASAHTSNPARTSRSRRSRRMIVSSSAMRMRRAGPALIEPRCGTAAKRRASSRRKHYFRTSAVLAEEREAPLQLVADERAHDREPRALGGALRAGTLVGNREDDVAVAERELDPDRAGAVLERVLEQLAEDERERGGTASGERDGLEARLDHASRREPLDEHCAQPVDQLGELDVFVALFRQDLVDRGNGEDAIHGVLERLARVDTVGARLEAQQRRHGLQVVLHAMVDLLRKYAAHHGATVLERDCSMVRDRLEQRTVVVGERRVAVGDELADHTALPAQRRAYGVLAGPAFRPGDPSVLEHERRA